MEGQKDSEFASSYTLDADFLVSAVGQLNSPREPNIPGLKKFQGKMMHSARWDWSYDLSQKRIAIIGNGMQMQFLRSTHVGLDAHLSNTQAQQLSRFCLKSLRWHLM